MVVVNEGVFTYLHALEHLVTGGRHGWCEGSWGESWNAEEEVMMDDDVGVVLLLFDRIEEFEIEPNDEEDRPHTREVSKARGRPVCLGGCRGRGEPSLRRRRARRSIGTSPPPHTGWVWFERESVRSATDPACQRPRCQSINQSNEFDGTHTRLWGEGPQPRALELLGAGKINVEMCGVVPSRFEVRAERRPRRAAKRLSLAHTYPLFLGAGRHPFSPGVCPGLASCVVQPGVLEGGMDG